MGEKAQRKARLCVRRYRKTAVESLQLGERGLKKDMRMNYEINNSLSPLAGNQGTSQGPGRADPASSTILSQTKKAVGGNLVLWSLC